MKFFLMILIFTPSVLADDVRGDTEEPAGQQMQPVCIFISKDVCVTSKRDIERIMGQGAVRYVMEDAEEIAAQRAQAVRDSMEAAEEMAAQRARAIIEKIDMGPELKLRRITPIPQAPMWKNLRPEVKRVDIKPHTQRIPLSSQRSQMEMYHDMSVIGKHLSGLIASSDGALCNLSQDPLQCCDTFAQNPDQCLVEKIEQGLLDLSSLTKGVCDVSQNMERCASQAKLSVLLQLATQKAKWGSRTEQISYSSVMDPGLQEVLKSDRERAKSGVRFPLPLPCVRDPLSAECMEILEIIGSLPAYNFSTGDDSSPGFSSIMDYPMEALSSPLSLELSDYDMAALRILYSRQVGAACKDDPNSKKCITLIEAMTLHGRSSGMSPNFSASDESSSDRADTFSGEQISTPSVMDYGTLQQHQLGKVIGLPHYELNEADFKELRKYYKGTETPSAFPEGR